MGEVDDHMYYETLSEIVYNDKKIVTFKGLSALLGVHVNVAKRMLYTFYSREKKEGKTIHAIMYLSGILAKPSGESSGSATDAVMKHSIVLCNDDDLLKTKSTYQKLFSVHIYAISSFPVTDYSVLQQGSTTLGDVSGGTSMITFGPFKVHESNKARPAVVPAISHQPVKEEPRQSVEKHSKPEPVAKPAKRNIMSAFAATKPPAKKASPKKEEDVKPAVSRSPEVAKKPSKPILDERVKKGEAKSKSRRSKEPTRKRSRIIMQSDSESDEEEQPASKRSVFESSDDEPPAPIDLTSDDEDEPTVQVKTESPNENKEPCSKGRKKIAKTIHETYMDDEGYVVTKKVQVMVSEDEGDTGDSSKPATQPQSSPVKKENGTAKSPKKQSTINGSAKQSKPGDVVPKKKQASIMSFFAKKN